MIAHTFGDTGFPLALLDLDTAAYGADETERYIQHLTYRSDQGLVHDFSAPIFDGRLGSVRLGLTESRLNGIINTT